ncbi:MAG TPA: HEAT repeat domain-containing protein [Terriglobales bacterium]|nr:HEAT repeat domain-containing protein [Terriglobales bacterium]
MSPEFKHVEVSAAPIEPRKSSAPRIAILVGTLIALAILFPRNSAAKAVWQQISQLIGLEGRPEPVSANVLSEHELEQLDKMSPQSQALLLLERSINHFKGANQEIARRVDGWRGNITLDDKLNGLFTTALNSDDLRVRAAAIEVDIAARDLVKSSTTIDAFESDARSGAQGARANALWNIGLLGNRGVQPERAADILLSSIHDGNENVRYWAVEGLAYLGTDETIGPLLEVFRNDPSPNIRERAACSLAQSGMLSEKQRRSAVPKLLEFAEDNDIDTQTKNWVFQALRDITGQTLPHDATAWRNWYNRGDERWNPVTHDEQ